MTRIGSTALIGAFVIALIGSASAEPQAAGNVLEHSGNAGDLIASRDGVVYWLSSGDKLFPDDILRARYANTSTINYNDCVFTLPAKQDVVLDEEFCSLTLVEKPSLAKLASETAGSAQAGSELATVNAPLIVGGVMLSAGGLAAASNGGSSGTESDTSIAAGATSGTVDP